MIKLDLSPTPLTYAANSNIDLACVRRLIVLIPPGTDFRAATRRVWELANTTSMPVQLIGLGRDATEEYGLHRELITMASLLQDGKVTAEAKVELGTNWLEVVKTNYRIDDMIVCFAEQRTGLLRRPLSQILESNLKATVYIISGLTPQESKPNRLLQITAWIGSIAVIIGFGILQAKVIQLPEGWLQSVLLIISIFPEFWLIWVWNSLFS